MNRKEGVLTLGDKIELEEFGYRLRTWRLANNHGLRDFAKMINISPAILSRVETAFSKKLDQTITLKPKNS